MLRTIFLLCLVAPAFAGDFGVWKDGLRILYGTDMFGMGDDIMIEMPMSNHSAVDKGYIMMNRPRLPPGYCSLQLWCTLKDMYRVCLFIDKTGKVAGLQFNVPCDEFIPKFNMEEQGFTKWTTVLHNKIVKFWSFYQFFTAADYQKRIESKNPDAILRGDELYYSSFDGQLTSVATKTSKLHSIYKKQNCVAWMGILYYYNMTIEMECSASTMSPFAAMFNEGNMIGTRVTVIGTWVKRSKHQHLYEDIKRLSVLYAVGNGPSCMFRILKDGGLSMTFWFTETPWLINCITKTFHHDHDHIENQRKRIM